MATTPERLASIEASFKAHDQSDREDFAGIREAIASLTKRVRSIEIRSAVITALAAGGGASAPQLFQWLSGP
jgi:hypothetical protein